MKFAQIISAVAIVLLSACSSTGSSSSSTVNSTNSARILQEGKQFYSVRNLRADTAKRRTYALNYLLPSLIPICSTVTVTDIDDDEISYTYNGMSYTHVWDKYSKGAGVSIEDSFLQFFSDEDNCSDIKAKISTMSEVDQQGIAQGRPLVGMTKDAVVLAVGRPPFHATPDLSANTWMYWLNRWKRQAVDFDNDGIVTAVRL